MAWWDQVAACKQQAKSSTTQLSEDERAASSLFSAPSSAPEEEDEDGENSDDDEGNLDDDAGVQKLTAKQMQRLGSMVKYPVEKRAHGNWLAKGISGMEGLASKRQAVAERQTHHRAQLEEAARLHDSRMNEPQAKRARHHVEGPKREDLYKTAVALTAAYGGAHAEADAAAPAEGLSAHEGAPSPDAALHRRTWATSLSGP